MKKTLKAWPLYFALAGKISVEERIEYICDNMVVLIR